jgi:hypothetical protein
LIAQLFGAGAATALCAWLLPSRAAVEGVR